MSFPELGTYLRLTSSVLLSAVKLFASAVSTQVERSRDHSQSIVIRRRSRRGGAATISINGKDSLAATRDRDNCSCNSGCLGKSKAFASLNLINIFLISTKLKSDMHMPWRVPMWRNHSERRHRFHVLLMDSHANSRDPLTFSIVQHRSYHLLIPFSGR